MGIQSVVIIGSGNVASAMGLAFKRSGIQVMAVYSRNLQHAKALARQLDAKAVDQPGDVPLQADLYLLAVKDEAIGEVAKQLSRVNGLMVHTSGSTPLAVLAGHLRHGVFYALQTFNKQQPGNLNQVPFLVEAATPADEQALTELALCFSTNVQPATTEQRQALHVAAVFANNFTNHLYAVSKALLDKHNLSFDLLKPLIIKTADNALHGDPATLQTGPAIRNDRNILSLHLRLLENNPQWREIYEVMSKSIASLPGKND